MFVAPSQFSTPTLPPTLAPTLTTLPPSRPPQVAPLVVRAVRESVFYETSADPIRFSLLGLDLITRPQPPTAMLLSAATVGEDEEGGAGEGVVVGVARQDRWFFTLLLCKLLSG